LTNLGTSAPLLADEVERLRRRMRAARFQILESDQQRETMRQSRSWQFTEPLRSVAGTFPRFARICWLGIKFLVWSVQGNLPARIRGWCRARDQAQEGGDDPPYHRDPQNAESAVEKGGPLFEEGVSQLERPSILVADVSLPDPERSAGDRSSFQILQALAKSGYRVFSWYDNRIPDEPTRIRLESFGVVVMGPSRVPDLGDWLEKHGRSLNFVLLARPGLTRKLLQMVIRYSDAKLIYYGHDLHYARLQAEAKMSGDPDLAERAERMRANERGIWRLVDTVIYPSDAETKAVRAQEPLVSARTLTLCAFDRFTTRHMVPNGANLLFVGSYGHPPNRDAALWLASEVFPAILRVRPDARLILAGSGPTQAILALAGPSISVPGRLTEQALTAIYDTARVVLAPLRFGAGVKGKILEALSLGVPLVTTSVGAQGIPNLEAIVPVFDDTERLVAATVRLLTDDVEWHARSRAQAMYASEHFSHAAFEASLMQALSA
jgi:glycosyltransferase involved in cell wall biosynthesis